MSINSIKDEEAPIVRSELRWEETSAKRKLRNASPSTKLESANVYADTAATSPAKATRNPRTSRADTNVAIGNSIRSHSWVPLVEAPETATAAPCAATIGAKSSSTSYDTKLRGTSTVGTKPTAARERPSKAVLSNNSYVTHRSKTSNRAASSPKYRSKSRSIEAIRTANHDTSNNSDVSPTSGTNKTSTRSVAVSTMNTNRREAYRTAVAATAVRCTGHNRSNLDRVELESSDAAESADKISEAVMLRGTVAGAARSRAALVTNTAIRAIATEMGRDHKTNRAPMYANMAKPSYTSRTPVRLLSTPALLSVRALREPCRSSLARNKYYTDPRHTAESAFAAAALSGSYSNVGASCVDAPWKIALTTDRGCVPSIAATHRDRVRR